MIISDVDKFVFIHNPKCGGTTVRESLMKYDMRSNYFWMFENIFGREIDKAHLPLDLLKIYYPNEFKLLSDYFVFGFTRDPIDRFVSSFNEANQSLFEGVKNAQVSEDVYISKINECAISLNLENVSGNDFGFRHFIEQNKMFYLEGKCYADTILKIGDVDVCADVFSILKPSLVSIAGTWNEKKKNVKRLGFTPKDSLNSKSILNLRKVYAKDFILFDY